MPFGSGQKKQRGSIAVTMIDAASGRPFATTGLPPDQLPETFHELETSMHVGGDDWLVERADPIDRAGYIAAGHITLVLRKVEKIDPSTILFSLPTLENALPPMQAGDASPAYEMHEDDWRQREFVSLRLAGKVEEEFAEIRKVWSEQDGAGFPRCHIRSKVTEPLQGVELTLADVAEALGGIEPVALGVSGNRVIDGFAFPLPGGAAYTRLRDGVVEALGLHGDAEPGGLRGVANEQELTLIDWIRASAS